MDWNARLTRAERQNTFLYMERDLAGDWPTCAVGGHSGQYAARDSRRPRAAGLLNLGYAFNSAIHQNEVAKARAIYDRIQAWFRRYGKAA